MVETGALVYVVDDDVSAREGAGRLIHSAGLRTETFASAQESSRFRLPWLAPKSCHR
jgi:FixJ family two-component response regulator